MLSHGALRAIIRTLRARRVAPFDPSHHSGSFFFAEMRRTVSSVSPLGIFSDSMSLLNPHLYGLFSIF